MTNSRTGTAPPLLATAAQSPSTERETGTAAALAKLFEANDEAQFHRRLDEFAAAHLEPLLTAAVAGRLRRNPNRLARGPEGPAEIEATEVFGAARLRLILRLQTAWERPTPNGEPPIRHVAAYVERAVASACSEFRGRNPAWRSLHLRTRRVLDRSPVLACWRVDDGDLLAGLSEWRTQGVPKAAGGPPHRLPDGASGGKIGVKQFPTLVVQTLHAYGAPVPYPELLTTLAKLLHIRDPLVERAGSSMEGDDPLEQIPAVQAGVEAIVADRDLVRRAWLTITAMPPNWRTAVLLGREDLFPLLFETGTARLSLLAAAVGMTAVELATQWNEIPLPDSAIAERLGITVGSVRNCRSWALKQLRTEFAE